MTLLAFAPLAYLLASDGKLLLAGVCWLGIQAVEPLPDRDFHLPGLSHRGVSHSLLAVFIVGVVLGGVGWLLGGFGFDLLYSLLTALVGIWDWVLGHLPELSTAFLTGLIPNLPPGEIVTTLQQQAGGNVRWSFVLFGFVIGVYGVVAHLLGDVITTQGIRPFLPFSRWQLSLSPLRADSPTANSALFGAGMVAIALVVALTVPGLLLGGGPAALSPVGVADAQTATNTTNATNASANTTNVTSPSSNATVTFANQTTNGSTVTVQSVTLPRPGYVALQSSAYADGLQSAGESTIAVSKRLSAGTHRNVTLTVSNAPPGNAPGLNRSQVNETTTFGVVAYADTNGNRRFDYVRSFGETDTLLANNGSTVADTARVRVPTPPQQAASVALANQTLDDGTLTVERARLPDGGFLVVHNESYRQNGDPLTSVVAASKYLEPGNYTNVQLDISPIYLTRTQVVTVRPARDTNGNQRYNFVRSDGFQDVAYETLNHSDTIENTARVRAPASRQTVQPASSDTPEQPATTGAATSSRTTASGNVEGSNDGLFGLSPLQLIVGGLVVLVVAPYLIGKLRQ
jgi:membrane-bound metal-dependent hydrolase YbcI (DUF457 family)